MLFRFALLAAVAFLLAACGGDGPPSPAVVPTAPQPEQSQEQEQASDESDELLSEQAQQVAEQSAESDDVEAPVDSPDEQSESQPPTPRGPPEPEFVFSIAVEYLEHLAGALGPRASGTEQERAAAEYLADSFRRLGYAVEVQEFPFTALVSYSRIDAADGDGYSAIAFRFPGSSNNAVVAKIVDVPGFGESADFQSADVNGRIAIVDRGVIEFRIKAANAEAAGAIGLIIANRDLSESIGGTFGADTSEIPVLQVSKEAGDELRARLGTFVSIPEAAASRGQSQNVIARKPDGVCRVVVGGHYDTVPDVDGANDNASGTALTLTLAEVWAEHPGAVDICFVGFGAEELGLHGSIAYVESLRLSGQLSELTAMLNLDAIGDGRAPYRIIASVELREISDSTASELGINAATGTLPMELGSDHASFVEAGIPIAFVFPPGGILHTPLDNLANVDYEVYADIALLNHGILACLLERAGSPISPTLSCGAQD